MPIHSKYLNMGIAALAVTSVVIQGFSAVHAQPYGYVQADCPNIVKQAIDTVSAQCGKTARGKLCYGNSNITAQFQPGANNVQFSVPGDTVDVNALKQFTLGGMDTAANTWGVAEMKIKADLPDADPSQAVTMIMFGDVHLSDASNDANASYLTLTPGAVAQWNQQATATAHVIDQKETQIAATSTKIAGLEATATAHALTPTPTGTIPAYKATQVAATATRLAAIENTATAVPIVTAPVLGVVNGPYKDLQAFYFQSGDTAPCDQAPHDGILIQAPDNLTIPVKLRIDDAIVYLNSTVFITAQANKFLTISTLEGSVDVVQAGTSNSVTLLPDTYTRLPLDANLHVSGPPTPFAFYTADMIRLLPTEILPNTSVSYAPAVSPNVTIDNWTEVGTTISGPCLFRGGKTTVTEPAILAYNDTTMWYTSDNTGTTILVKSTQGTYVGSKTFQAFTPQGAPIIGSANKVTINFTVVSPTHASETDMSAFSGGSSNGVVCVANFDLTRGAATSTTLSPSTTP